jgi:hypothetical protein
VPLPAAPTRRKRRGRIYDSACAASFGFLKGKIMILPLQLISNYFKYFRAEIMILNIHI